VNAGGSRGQIMLVIRKEQVEVFKRDADNRYFQRLVQHLRKNYADQVDLPPDEILHERVRTGVDRARQHGFTLEKDITSFVALMFAVAPNFDHYPAVAEVLKDLAIRPEHRMKILLAVIPRRHWERPEGM
jgi:hypothetical protein